MAEQNNSYSCSKSRFQTLWGSLLIMPCWPLGEWENLPSCNLRKFAVHMHLQPGLTIFSAVPLLQGTAASADRALQL